MAPYVVGGTYANSVEGVGVGGSILYLDSEGCLPLGVPQSAMRTREVVIRQHISPLDVAALPAISWPDSKKKKKVTLKYNSPLVTVYQRKKKEY